MNAPELISPTITFGYIYSHKFHICLYDSTCEAFFVPAYMLGYPIQSSLITLPENISQK